MIAIVDYGMGNFGSMTNMFKRIGVDVQVVQDVEGILEASKLVLPGVGSFDTAMHCINNSQDVKSALTDRVLKEKVPVLGVCLGMQMLTRGSEEGDLPGLGWIPASAIRFPCTNGNKVPHMGWNSALPTNHSLLTHDIEGAPRYYFAHSYYVKTESQKHSLMKCNYGMEFDAAIGMDNIYGVQFHPEKSHRYGMQILSNFANL